MPARTNQFQKLVYEIERQLAPLGAVVEESAMLPERVTGELREVDILVSLDEGHHRVRIGIECQDRSRPATKQWVEAIAKKHEDLGINKTVLISSSGFYAAARRRAESLFVSVLDITGIAKADWPTEVLRNLKVPVRDRSSEIIKIGWGFLELGPGQTRKTVSNLKGVTAQLPNGPRVDLLKVVQQYGNGILEQAAGQDEGPQVAIGRLHHDLRLYRGREFIGVVRFLFLRWKHTTRFFAIRLKPFRYGNRVLAVGQAKRRGIQWTASAIVESPGVVRIRCEAPGTLKTTLRVGKLPKGQEHLAM
ncbi:MAG: hypothetical protein ABSH21_10890 [Verrucomicrobiia bacterium]|jgi:hypothetical protein